MNTKCLFCLILTVMVSYNCNQPVIAAWNHNYIIGDYAIKDIMNAGNFMDTAYYSSSSNPGSYSSMSVYSSINTINSILIPIVSKIDKKKYYTKESVEACVSKIYTLGLILDSFLSVAISCKIREAPLIDTP